MVRLIMQDHTASRTALGVAYIRAAHQIYDSRPLLFPDPVALPLLGPDAAGKIEALRERHQSPFGRGLRSHLCLRARFAEDRLAADPSVRWYVLVGAGFDTFALRQPAWAGKLRIVEVDHPATQNAKREMIAAAGFAVPDNLFFEAADFTRETLGVVLARRGIAPEEPVAFSWLGVTMYLEEAAIDASLAAMASVSQRSSVTLSFKPPLDEAVPGEAKLAEFVAGLGEAYVSFFTPEAMAKKLAGHGFVQQAFLTPALARETYYTPNPGLPPPRHTTIVHAAKR